MNLQKNARRLAAAGIVAATATVGLAAGSAQAVSSNGCTATPLGVTYGYTNSIGQKVMRYSLRVSCWGHRSVQIQHQIRERDFLTSQLIKNSSFTRSFPVAGTQTISVYRVTPNTEPGNEEMYHRLRIRVIVGGIVKPWSGWHSSAVVSLPN